LNVAWTANPEVGVKAPVIGRGTDPRAKIRRRLSKIGVIESVKERGAEFEIQPLGDFESFTDGNIPRI
jgi:hypothetical protein